MAKKMKCMACREAYLTSRRETVKYDESGLSFVTLANVEVRTCPNCGEREIVLPRIEELHRVIALQLANKPGPLVSEEIRFLRKYLGYSGGAFAKLTGHQPETV